MQKPIPTDIEKEVRDIDLIVSKSDEKGNITYMNPIFVKISGYSQGELLESPHAILRHPDMPKVIFEYLWENIKEAKAVSAFVKNLCKDGSYYWVLATVKMAKNPDGSFRNYMSTRKCVTPHAKKIISDLYAQLLQVEKNESLEASRELLHNFFTQNNITDAVSFSNYMQNLNKGKCDD
jgi:PAS domain S-box-containing protein